MQTTLTQKLSNAKSLFNFADKNLYGLRARPFSIGAQPNDSVLYLDHFEAVAYLDQLGLKVGSNADIRHGLLAYKTPLDAQLVDNYELVYIDKPMDVTALLLAAKRAISRSPKLQLKFSSIENNIKALENKDDHGLPHMQQRIKEQIKQAQAEGRMVSARMTNNDACIHVEFTKFVSIGGDKSDWDQMVYEALDHTDEYSYEALSELD